MYCRACFTNLPDAAETCRTCGRDPRAAPAEPAASTAAPGPPVAVEEASAPRPRWLAAGATGLAVALAASALLVLARPRLSVTIPATTEVRDAPPETSAVTMEAEPLSPVEAAETDLGPAAEIYAAALAAYRSGDLPRAVALLREAVAAAPDTPRLEAALTAALEGLAASHLDHGDVTRAEPVLVEVVSREPERGQAWKGLGYVQLEQGRLSEARASLETATRLLPDDADAQLLLGNVLYQLGEAEAALGALRAGRAARAGDASYDAFIARVEREVRAEAGFSRAESDHFTVSFEGGGTSAQAGYLVSLLLEDAYHAVGSRLDYYPGDPVHAVLYPAERFRDVTRSPEWAGALFDGKIRLPVGGLTDRTEALERTIAHEYTHAVVHRIARGRAPVWLNEGLAQLAEGPLDGPLRERLRAHIRGGRPLASLRDLEGSFAGLDARSAELAYVQSLAATDFLVARYGRTAARRVLDRLGAGEPLPAALESVLDVPYEDLDRQWVESYR